MGKLQFDDVRVCHNCDYLAADKAVPTLTWPRELWDQWKAATHFNTNLEILALFRVDSTNTVTELHFPPQEVEKAACQVLEQDGQWDGLIHSHHDMGAFFSSDDKATALPNYRFNVVTCHKGDYKGAERITLPCGGLGFRDLTVEVEQPEWEQQLYAHLKTVCHEPAPPVVVTPMVPAYTDIQRRYTEYLELSRKHGGANEGRSNGHRVDSMQAYHHAMAEHAQAQAEQEASTNTCAWCDDVTDTLCLVDFYGKQTLLCPRCADEWDTDTLGTVGEVLR